MAAKSGRDHHNAKMTEATVKAARKTYATASWVVVDGKRQPVTAENLAKKYGVAKQTMWSLLQRKTWKHVS